MWYYNIGDLMNVVELLEKVKIAMENKDYDMVPIIFKKEIINKVVFYTKIKYKNKQVKILSCHEDE